MIKKTHTYSLLAVIFCIILHINTCYANQITIESDHQDFQINTNSAQFKGNVRVSYGDIKISSPNATLNSNAEGKPEKAIFSNGVKAFKKVTDSENELLANNITLLLETNKLIARGETISTIKKAKTPSIVIQADQQIFDNANNNIKATGNVSIKYKDMNITANESTFILDDKNKPIKAKFSGGAKINQGSSTISAGSIDVNLTNNDVIASGGVNSKTSLQGSLVSMSSNYQTYNKLSRTITGSGNVKVVYKDYIAHGPRATILMASTNTLDKIIFSGRSSIKDSNRNVSADKIIISINPKNFVAEGNVKTQFNQDAIKKQMPIKVEEKKEKEKELNIIELDTQTKSSEENNDNKSEEPKKNIQ